MKKLCAVVLVVLSLFTLCVPAMAYSAPQATEAPSIETGEVTWVDVLDGNAITPFGLSAPTSFWDLAANGSYGATISGLRYSVLYTNRYFKPNSSGRLYVSTLLNRDYPNQGGSQYDLILYRRNAGEQSSYTCNIGQQHNVQFYNLDTSAYYYFGWEYTTSGGATASGSATVSH